MDSVAVSTPPSTPSILGDVRVLDLSEGFAGPLAARFLGDFGADVVKVELPEGERGRRMAPFNRRGESLVYLLANLNKRGVSLDYRAPDGKAELRELICEADIVVASWQPGMLAALGLSYDELRRENPALIVVSITPFGLTGPYSDYKADEIVTYAMGGIMSYSGMADREPLKHGGMQSQYEGALSAAVAANAALYMRDLSGEGDLVDISLQEVVASTLVIQQTMYSWAGAVQGRRKPGSSNFGQIQPCKDGYFVWQTGGGASWEDIAEFFGQPELHEERFATLDGRQLNGVEMDGLVVKATRDRTMKELFQTASEKYRMLFGIVQKADELVECPQLAARSFYETVETSAGPLDVPFQLFSTSDSPATLRRPAPELGEHTQEVLAERLSGGRSAAPASNKDG